MTLRRFFTRALFSACLAGGVAAFSVGASAETMSDAVNKALTNHPRIKAALSNMGAMEAGEKQAVSGLFPALNVDASGGRMYGDNSTSRGLSVTRGAGYTWLWQGGVTMSQHLFDGFATEEEIRAAAARRSSAGFEVLDLRETLALQAAVTYLDVLRTQESLKKLKDHKKRLESYESRIKQMVEDGGADASMVMQASDILAQLENAIVNMSGEHKTALAGYAEIMGHEPDTVLVKPVPPLDMIPGELTEAVSFAQEFHPAVKATEMNRAAREHDLQAEKSELYPEFTGELSYFKKDQRDLLGGEVIDAKAIVRMSWDYELGGAHRARVREGLEREAESRARLEELMRQIEKEIRVAYSDKQTAQEQIKIQQRRVSLNRDLLSTYEDQFEAGRVNILQIMQADNSLFNSQMALLNGEYRSLASQFAVLASMGRLQEALEIVPQQAIASQH